MQNIQKAKEHVLQQMDDLRKRLGQLEADLELLNEDADQGWDLLNPREKRPDYDGDLTLGGDFAEVEAHGVDLSEGGVCFEVQEDLTFVLFLKVDDEDVERRASLAWSRRMADGRTRLGFKFVGDDQPADPE